MTFSCMWFLIFGLRRILFKKFVYYLHAFPHSLFKAFKCILYFLVPLEVAWFGGSQIDILVSLYLESTVFTLIMNI